MKRLGLLLLLMVVPLAASATDSYNLGANVVTAGNYVQQIATNVNLTGTDTVSLASGSQKLTLPTTAAVPGGEFITISKGTLPITPSGTSLLQVAFQICQASVGSGGGNQTLSIVVDGSTVSNLYWSGGSQPGYTLTAGHGDAYSCSFDGANLRCAETMSDQPC